MSFFVVTPPIVRVTMCWMSWSCHWDGWLALFVASSVIERFGDVSPGFSSASAILMILMVDVLGDFRILALEALSSAVPPRSASFCSSFFSACSISFEGVFSSARV